MLHLIVFIIGQEIPQVSISHKGPAATRYTALVSSPTQGIRNCFKPEPSFPHLVKWIQGLPASSSHSTNVVLQIRHKYNRADTTFQIPLNTAVSKEVVQQEDRLFCVSPRLMKTLTQVLISMSFELQNRHRECLKKVLVSFIITLEELMEEVSH